MVLLQRLPGLGRTNSEDGSRSFIDKDFVDVARSGSVFKFIDNPYNNQLNCESWQSTLDRLAIDLIAHRCEISKFNPGKINCALGVAHKDQRSSTLAVDIFMVLVALGFPYESSTTYLREVAIEGITFDDEDRDFSVIEFQDCAFVSLEIGPGVSFDKFPKFLRCHFANVIGRSGERDLPEGRFTECTFDQFENRAQTTSAILKLSLPPASRVLLTVIKKIFAQSGSGRIESALYKGLEPREKEVVPQVLSLMRKHGFIIKSRQGTKTVWLPPKDSEFRKRALSILTAPHNSADVLFLESKKI
ncbi:MAG: hypothetical protein HY579_14185 [Nitrospinae bacterium]|nr:hypothetical protein [Nitrospinota bacterium]